VFPGEADPCVSSFGAFAMGAGEVSWSSSRGTFLRLGIYAWKNEGSGKQLTRRAVFKLGGR